MNLSTGRILIIVALIVAGLAVLANGFLDSDTTLAAGASTSPSASVSPSTSQTSSASPTPTPAPQTEGVAIMALNGTDVAGAGAAAQSLLVADGYTAPKDAADVPGSAGVNKTIVYYRDDENAAQNKADATYIADTYFDGAPVKKLDPELQSIVQDSVAVVVVVGADYASKITA